MTNHREIGNQGEDLAVVWLEAHGYQVIERNYHARVGEIDIIARYTETNRLCFVEVKTRKYRDGSAEYAHTGQKHEKILASARKYCQEREIPVDLTEISFEHISVYTAERGDAIDHYILPSF